MTANELSEEARVLLRHLCRLSRDGKVSEEEGRFGNADAGGARLSPSALAHGVVSTERLVGSAMLHFHIPTMCPSSVIARAITGGDSAITRTTRIRYQTPMGAMAADIPPSRSIIPMVRAALTTVIARIIPTGRGWRYTESRKTRCRV